MLEAIRSEFDQIVVLDTETTGIFCQRDEIIELGILTSPLTGDHPAVEREDDALIRLSSGRRVPEAIVRLTGIDDELLREEGVEKPTACRVLESYLGAEKTLLVAYNAQFDLCFLYYFLRQYGDPSLLRGLRFLDAMTVYKDRRPYPHKLVNAVEAYRLETQNTHRAVDDAHATLELLYAMALERDDLDRYINLFGYHPKYGVSGPRISSIRYVPQGYDTDRPLYEK